MYRYEPTRVEQRQDQVGGSLDLEFSILYLKKVLQSIEISNSNSEY